MRREVSLGVVRVALGTLVLVRTTPASRFLPWPVSHVPVPLLGWPEHGFHAAWLGLAVPSGVVVALCIVRTIAAIAFTLGVRTRVAGAVVAASGFAALSQDVFAFKYTLYTLFVGVALVGTSNRWLVRMFVASVYLWAGIAKLRLEWLHGDTLRHLHDAGYFFGWLGDAACATPLRCEIAAWMVVIVELALAPLLLAQRTRTFAIGLAIVMHAVYEWTTHPDVFGWLMVVLLAACATPSSRRSAPSARDRTDHSAPLARA